MHQAMGQEPRMGAGCTSRARSLHGLGSRRRWASHRGSLPAKGSAALKCTAIAFLFSDAVLNRRPGASSRHSFKRVMMMMMMIIIIIIRSCCYAVWSPRGGCVNTVK